MKLNKVPVYIPENTFSCLYSYQHRTILLCKEDGYISNCVEVKARFLLLLYYINNRKNILATIYMNPPLVEQR